MSMISAEEFEIPPKCQDCGIQCDLASKILKLAVAGELVEGIGGSLLGESGEKFNEMLRFKVADEEIADRMAESTRQGVGDSLEKIERQVEDIKEDSAAYALACQGILKMQATKGDVTYTVSVCTSARAYTRDNGVPKHLGMHIQADSAQ